MFAGFPQIAEGEGGLFYPGNIILWLPGDQAVLLSWTVVLHLILAGCLMYAFLRGRGAGRATSAWLAVFYQFLPGLLLRAETVGLFEAAAWLPGFFWACERAVGEWASGWRSRWLMWTLFAAAQIGFMLLTGSSQIAFYAMIGSVFFLGGVVTMGPRSGSRLIAALLTFFIVGGLGAALAAIQLLPTSELAGISYRLQGADTSYYRMGTWLNVPRLASLFVFPAVKSPDQLLDYVTSLGYIGLLPFSLAGISLSLRRRHMNPILPAFFLAFFGLLLAFGLNFSANQDLITFPGFNMFRALGRMVLPATIALMALAADGLEALMRASNLDSNRRQVISGIWAAAIIAAVLLVWYVSFEKLPLSGMEILGLGLLIPAALVSGVGLWLYTRTRRSMWLIALLAVWLAGEIVGLIPIRAALTMDRGSFAQVREALRLDYMGLAAGSERPTRVLVASETEVWQPLLERLAQAPFSSSTELPIPAYGNELSLAGLATLNGYTPLITDRWYALAHKYAARGLSQVPLASGRFRSILAITCTDAIIAPPSFTGGTGFTETGVPLDRLFPRGWHLLKAPQPLPYASLPRHLEAWDGSDWEAFAQWTGQPSYVPGEWVAVEIGVKDPILDNPEQGGVFAPFVADSPDPFVYATMDLPPESTAEVFSVERRGAAITINVRADSPRWLVVRESYMPGWSVRVDGRPSEVYPADYVFCGVPLPSGTHTVRMVYTTPRLAEGMRVSIVAWIIWLVGLVGAVPFSRPRRVILQV